MSGPSPRRRPTHATTGEPHSVKDRPQFEADDTTTSYSPPRTDRPRWVDQGWGSTVPAGTSATPGTPQHWFDPTAGPGPSGQLSAAPAARKPAGPSLPQGRGPVIVGGILLALVSAALASGGTFGLLAAGGYLDGGDGAAASPGISTVKFPQQQTLIIEQSDNIRAAAAVSPAVVTITNAAADDSNGVASGVIYDPAGWILTNRHVVCGAESLIVQLADGRRFTGETYGIDTLTDLAIVRVNSQGLPAASIGDSSALKPGQVSLAVGSSLGTLTTSVTSGVVSALGRDVVVDDACGTGRQRSLRNLIQTDAAINPGNSGGALVNANGDVIGINTAVAGGAQGIGFAIPINIAKPIMLQAVGGMLLTRPFIGVTFIPLNAGVAQELGLPIDHGALVQGAADGSAPGVIPGSPAEAAGIQDGDIITAIDDQRIDSAHPLDDILAQYRPVGEDPLVIWVLRGGTPMELKLVLGTRRAEQV
jgi:serine protease Do